MPIYCEVRSFLGTYKAASWCIGKGGISETFESLSIASNFLAFTGPQFDAYEKLRPLMPIPVLVSFPSPPWVTSKHADHGQPHIKHFLATYRAEIRYMKKTGSLDFGSGFACPCSPPCPSVAGEHTDNGWSMSYRVLPVHVQGAIW